MTMLHKRKLCFIGLAFLGTLSVLVLQSTRSFAFEIDGSWPHFETKNKTSTTVKKRKKKYRRNTSKKRRVKRKVAARFRYKRKRKSRKRHKKRKASKMSAMTNHDAESKRKHKVITVKTFEYPDLMTEAASKGEALFNIHCIGCHGKNALGTGNGPPLLHDYYRPGHHADLAIYAAPTYGVEAHHWKFGDMPKIEAVSKKDVHNLLIYIRTMQRANGIY